MLLALYNRNFELDHLVVYQQFISLANQYDIQLTIYTELAKRLSEFIEISTFECYTGNADLNPNTDFMISFGGDGTILDAVLMVADSGIPILGINLGRLGFLADVQTDSIEFALQCLINRNYTLDSRGLLMLESNTNIFDKFPYALNDFTIHKKDTSAMMKINTYLNGQFLNSYWCDGLIISTPTGSTGYSLSCGGPVIFPQSKNFSITPIAPHHLNVRPVIVPNDYVLSFEMDGRADHFLCTLDSRQEIVDKTVNLAVRKADFEIKLVRIASFNFLDTIRNKMHWGMDNRN